MIDLQKAIEKNSKEIRNIAKELFRISEAFNVLKMTDQAYNHFELARSLLNSSNQLKKNFAEYLKDNFK